MHPVYRKEVDTVTTVQIISKSLFDWKYSLLEDKKNFSSIVMHIIPDVLTLLGRLLQVSF